MTQPSTELNESITSHHGKPLRSAHKTHGTGVRVQFGELHQHDFHGREQLDADVDILIFPAAWRLEKGGQILCGSGSDDNIASEVLPRVSGSLQSLLIGDSGDFKIDLSGGYLWSVFKDAEDEPGQVAWSVRIEGVGLFFWADGRLQKFA